MKWLDYFKDISNSIFALFKEEELNYEIDFNNDIKKFFLIGFGVSTFFICVTSAYRSGVDVTNGFFPKSLEDSYILFNKNYHSINNTTDDALNFLNDGLILSYNPNYCWLYDISNPIKISCFKNQSGFTVEEIDFIYKDYLSKPTELDSRFRTKQMSQSSYLKYVFVGTCLTLYALKFVLNDYNL